MSAKSARIFSKESDISDLHIKRLLIFIDFTTSLLLHYLYMNQTGVQNTVIHYLAGSKLLTYCYKDLR